MSESKAYRAGFMDILAGYEKTAKMRYEMNADERKRADLAFSKMENERTSKIPTRNPEDPDPKTLVDWLGHLGKKTGRKAMSLGRGALSAAGVTGVRALESAADLALWLPGLVDSIAFGHIAGIDGGKGFLGRAFGKGHRLADSTVHKLRQWSEDYDYKNRIDSGFNRFIQGAGADTLGSFIGFGGLAGVGKKAIEKGLVGAGKKALKKGIKKGIRRNLKPDRFSRFAAPAMGLAFGVPAALLDGQQKQLRQREEMLRNIDHRYVQYFDPTSTPYNQENAPTLEEYKRYHHPSTHILPTSHTGVLKVPYSWRHNELGEPHQFIPYGE